MENEKAAIEAKKWNMANPAMKPVEVPYNCKAVYGYAQSIVHENPEDILGDSDMVFDGWGIAICQSDHILTLQEKESFQKNLKDKGAVTIGNMKLISQTFSRDKDAVSIDDLGSMFGEG